MHPEVHLNADSLGMPWVPMAGRWLRSSPLAPPGSFPSTMGQEEPSPPPPTETWLERLTTLRSIKELRCDSEEVLDSLSYHSLAESLQLYLDTFHARLIHDKLKQVNQI